MSFTVTPTSVGDALTFADQVRNRPHAVVVHPAGRHWEIFTRQCREAARFPGLRWAHPLD